jgi:signal transduction histidine kinase
MKIKGLWYDDSMNKATIEPGLIRLFKMFTGLEALILFMIIYSDGYLKGNFNLVNDRIGILFIQSTVLFAYLSWPWLHRKLRSAYLPIAITFATATPILANRISMILAPAESISVFTIDAWELFPLLFVPLVLIAWQYSINQVFQFNILIAIFDFLIILIFVKHVEYSVVHVLGVIAIRTLSQLIVGYMVTQLLETQRDQRKALAAANFQLNQHANALEQLTLSRERNRLARELHDTLAHTLSGMAVELEALKIVLPPEMEEAQQMVDQSLTMTRTGLTETRRALRDLRAKPLDDLGLSLALTNLVRNTAEREDLKSDISLPLSFGQLPEDFEQSLYRIAQEALENIVRHSHAKQIKLSVEKNDRLLKMIISDDGKGFTPNEISNTERLGIRGMRERAEMIHGQLEITSTPGKGTTVQLLIEEPYVPRFNM